MLPGLAALMLYALVLVGLSIAGLVLICVKMSKLVFIPAADEIPKGQQFRSVY